MYNFILGTLKGFWGIFCFAYVGGRKDLLIKW